MYCLRSLAFLTVRCALPAVSLLQQLAIKCFLGVILRTKRLLFADREDYAFFPIAMPGIAGPGTIAVVIGFSTEIAELPGYIDMAIAFAWTALAILCATSLSWFIMRYSDVISNRLGPSGTLVIGKLMGFLLICIGVQFVGSGIRTFIAGG